MVGRTNQLLSYLQRRYSGAIVQVTDDRIDTRALNSFCVWVPDVGKTWLYLRWNPETCRTVVTINLPARDTKSQAA